MQEIINIKTEQEWWSLYITVHFFEYYMLQFICIGLLLLKMV